MRVRILEVLRDGERTVGDIQERLGASGPNVSQHLAILREQGIVEARREGTSVIYCVADPLIYSLLDDARAIFERQIAQGAALLQTDTSGRRR